MSFGRIDIISDSIIEGAINFLVFQTPIVNFGLMSREFSERRN